MFWGRTSTGSGSGSWTVTVSPAENLVFFFADFPFTVTNPCSSSFCAPLRVRDSTDWARNWSARCPACSTVKVS